MTEVMNTVVLLGTTIIIPSILVAINMSFNELKKKNEALKEKIDILLVEKYNKPETCILSPKIKGGKSLLGDIKGRLAFYNEIPFLFSLDKNETFEVQLYIEKNK